MRAARLRVWLLAVTAVVVGAAPLASAYLKLGVTAGSKATTLKWSAVPITWFSEDRGVTGVTATEAQAAFARAFATWQAVPTATVAYQFGGYTSARPLDHDGRSTLGFLDRPDLSRVLASTNYLIDDATGTIVEADIFFNTSYAWSTASGGAAGQYDLESIALHEIGHFNGLGHSALGETDLLPTGSRVVMSLASVMFPIAFQPGSVAARSLRPDDVAGVSDLYPEAGFDASTGAVTGHVTKNGVGVFGAHIVAFNPATGVMVGGFALGPGGQFSIRGLSPGVYVLRAEPLDDAEVGDFFDVSGVDVNFRVTVASTLAVVPRGGASASVDIAVEAR